MKKLLILIGMLFAFAGIASATTIVSTCATTITSPGTYKLNADLYCVDGLAATDAIRIYNTAGVTLDCKGHKITGDSFNGVVNVGRSSNVTVKNCEIKALKPNNYWASIAFMSWESSDVHVLNNVIDSYYEGITFRNTKDSERRDNIVNAVIGGWIFSSCSSRAPPHDTSNNIDRNNAYSGQYGTLLYDGCSNFQGDVYGNLIKENCYNTDNSIDFFNDGDTVDFAIYNSNIGSNIITENNFYGSFYLPSSTPYSVVDFSASGSGNVYDENFWTTNEYHYIASTGEFAIGAPSVDLDPEDDPEECGPEDDEDDDDDKYEEEDDKYDDDNDGKKDK